MYSSQPLLAESIFFYIWWSWGLNSGQCPCQASKRSSLRLACSPTAGDDSHLPRHGSIGLGVKGTHYNPGSKLRLSSRVNRGVIWGSAVAFCIYTPAPAILFPSAPLWSALSHSPSVATFSETSSVNFYVSCGGTCHALTFLHRFPIPS